MKPKGWRTMSDQDLLARSMSENPGQTEPCDRKQRRQTGGMVGLSTPFRLARIITAKRGRPGRAWSEDACDYLQCAVDHLPGPHILPDRDLAAMVSQLRS